MKNTFGTSVSVTLFGESHGEAIGAVLDGMAPGVSVDEEYIASLLDKRRSVKALSTPRSEADKFKILSGVFEGKTTGTPICIIIPNSDTRSKDYERSAMLARPGHADYTAECKYHGFQDFRGGGHFSGRITAALTAAGGIALSALSKVGIHIGTHISSLAGINDRSFDENKLCEDINLLSDLNFAVLDKKAGEAMQAEILAAKADGDSVGGVLETAVVGFPCGVGEPWFDTVESVLSHMLFSIPAVKGVEFGDGFGLSSMRGSEANDALCSENGEIKTKTNHMGGICGGITNGMPIIFRCAVKPTPSIFKTQETINLSTGENATLSLVGRHDPAIVHRARIVADCATALALCDLLALRYGTDFTKAPWKKV